MENLSEHDVIYTLWRFGHFRAPEALAEAEVTEDDLPALTLKDAVVRGAVRSYQSWFKPALDEVTTLLHRREGVADGDVGPATVELIGMPRCGIPDYPLEAREEASWPDSCRQQITTSYRMSLRGLTDEQLAAVWQEADQRWADALQVGFVFQPASYPQTRIYAFAARLGGNVLADQYLAQNDCAARLQGRVDSGRDWNAVLLVTTLAHEHGHALGLNHLQDQNALMYPSITNASMGRRGAPAASDVAEAVRLGYRRRESPPPSPPGADEVTIPRAGKWRFVG